MICHYELKDTCDRKQALENLKREIVAHQEQFDKHNEFKRELEEVKQLYNSLNECERSNDRQGREDRLNELAKYEKKIRSLSSLTNSQVQSHFEKSQDRERTINATPPPSERPRQPLQETTNISVPQRGLLSFVCVTIAQNHFV